METKRDDFRPPNLSGPSGMARAARKTPLFGGIPWHSRVQCDSLESVPRDVMGGTPIRLVRLISLPPHTLELRPIGRHGCGPAVFASEGAISIIALRHSPTPFCDCSVDEAIDDLLNVARAIQSQGEIAPRNAVRCVLPLLGEAEQTFEGGPKRS
ncbi:hypothetical protein MRS44_013267 [Fusarium solani]|uniref:uncharacterized protein n=1 Tax=Fusarium solani TaxID=169388 RepID=UPI0032C41B44|nr:hypothetical protein MRS44_013267 [Fusarium solani]